MGHAIYHILQVKVSPFHMNTSWEIQKHDKAGNNDKKIQEPIVVETIFVCVE